MYTPGFNYLRFKEFLTIDQYNKAYDSMIDDLHSDNRVIREMGQIKQRNHDNFPETFANVWLRCGNDEHWDVL